MPHYHNHFREESREVVRALNGCRTGAAGRGGIRAQLRRVARYFDGHCRGLSSHVSMEEGFVFSQLRSFHSAADLSELCNDHAALHQQQRSVSAMMTTLSQADTEPAEDDLCPLVDAAVAYDDALLRHLGEEEEIVVPLEFIGRQ